MTLKQGQTVVWKRGKKETKGQFLAPVQSLHPTTNPLAWIKIPTSKTKRYVPIAELFSV